MSDLYVGNKPVAAQVTQQCECDTTLYRTRQDVVIESVEIVKIEKSRIILVIKGEDGKGKKIRTGFGLSRAQAAIIHQQIEQALR